MKSFNPRWALVALRRGLTWRGRARRAEVWWYMGAYVPLALLLLGVWLLPTDGASMFDFAPVLATLLVFIGLVPGVACAIRRLHDLGRSGWWYLLVFATVPLGGLALDTLWESLSGWQLIAAGMIAAFSGGLILFYWFLQRGTIGENRYGPDPLMPE